MSANKRLTCMRELSCKPLDLFVYDDKDSFVCCGLHGMYDSSGHIDGTWPQYRMCMKRGAMDNVCDYDSSELLAMLGVISCALSRKLQLTPAEAASLQVGADE